MDLLVLDGVKDIIDGGRLIAKEHGHFGLAIFGNVIVDGSKIQRVAKGAGLPMVRGLLAIAVDQSAQLGARGPIGKQWCTQRGVSDRIETSVLTRLSRLTRYGPSGQAFVLELPFDQK